MICNVPLKVGIATRNEVKVRATESAVKSLCNIKEFLVVDPPSNLPKQPVGSIQVVKGALNRAITAYNHADLGIGIEAGPIEFYSSTGFLEIQVAIVIGPNGKLSIGLSPGFELPQGLLDAMLSGKELGELVSHGQEDLGELIGYIGVLTRGRVTRYDLTVHAVTMALTPWANNYYHQLPEIQSFMSILS